MRKFTIAVSAAALCLSVAACKGKDEAPATDDARSAEMVPDADGNTDDGLIAAAKTANAIVVSDSFARETAPDAKAGGAFMTLTNGTATDDILVSATAKFAGKVEMHESKMDNDVMVMRPLADGIPLKAGAVTKLAPGGLHIMFMDLKGPLRAGKEVEITLNFKTAAPQTLKLPVKSMADAPMAAGHEGGAHE